MSIKIEESKIMKEIAKEIMTNAETYKQMDKVGIGDYAIRQAVYSNIRYRDYMDDFAEEVLLSETDLEGILYRFSFRIKRIKVQFSEIDSALALTKYLFEEREFNRLTSRLKTKVFNRNKKEIHGELVSIVCRETKHLLRCI